MIRTAVPDDRDPLQRLLAASPAFRAEERVVAMELVDTFLAAGPASGYEVFCRIAGDGSLAGYACFGPVPLTDGCFDLYWIVVDPRRARQGIGSSLMDYVERAVAERGGRKLYIETSSTDPYRAARALYRFRHYEAKACFADFYRVGDHKIVFLKEIAPLPPPGEPLPSRQESL